MSAYSSEKRCRPTLSDDCDISMYESNAKKRTEIRRENIPEKHDESFKSIIPIFKQNDIGAIFRRDMPYGCQYDERNMIVSYFNYDFCYLGTNEKYDFAKMMNSKSKELYSASTVPITNRIHMLNYLNELFQFIHYICAGSLFNGSKYYYDARNYYQIVLFGS